MNARISIQYNNGLSRSCFMIFSPLFQKYANAQLSQPNINDA